MLRTNHASLLVVAAALIGSEFGSARASLLSGAADTADNPACRLAASALPRFKYLTTYGWHEKLAPWTNVGQSSSLEQIVAFYNETKNPGVLEISGVFFEAIVNATVPSGSHAGHKMRGMQMKPGWEASWSALVPQLQPLIEKHILTGFMLGDELVWNNISWVDLNATAARIKADCPEAFLFYNEGGAPLWGNYNVNHLRTEYPEIPPAVDFVSTDDYGTINTAGYSAAKFKGLANAPYQYKRDLYPRMSAHQKVFVIPPLENFTFPDCHGPGECTSVDSHGIPSDCPPCLTTDCLDNCILNQTIGYLRWIESDEMIVGIDSWSASGLADKPLTAACYATLGKQLRQSEVAR